MIRIFTLSLFLLLQAQQLLAQHRGTTISLAGREVAMSADMALLQEHLASGLSKEGAVQLYLHFSRPPEDTKLKPAGLAPQGYIQDNVYNVVLDRNPGTAALQQLGADAWAAVLPADKINPLLQHDRTTGSDMLLLVRKGMPEASLRAQVAGLGLRLTADQPWKQQDVWQVAATDIPVEMLARLAFVRAINPVIAPQPLNDQAIAMTNTQVAHQPLLLGGYNLHGEGVVVGVGDDSDPGHIDFIDRVRSFNPITASYHAFNTTGATAGNGIQDERRKGFAPAARIVADFFSQIIANAGTYYNDYGMVVANNSYGNILGDCGYAGTYDVYTQYCDQQLRDLPELLTIFAAANDGNRTCSPYPQGYATVAGSYQTAKNVLTVGSTGKTRLLPHSGSSRGPVKDGRLKPELTAVGMRVTSCAGLDLYETNTGTSMAAPNVSGAAALLVQRYRQFHGGQNPKGGLVKTLLMNGADDMDQPGPDFRYGFGLMNIGHSLRMIDSSRYFSGTVNTNQEQVYTFTIPANTARAKVMLYWIDPASQPLTTHALINDLDLTVTTPSGTTVLPLVPDPQPSQIFVPAMQSADHTNNVEQVTLNNPAPGTYTIRVRGYDVPEPSQEYFLAYDMDPTGVKMQYPFGGEALPDNDSVIVHWEASDDTNPFTLALSTDAGSSWTTLSNSLPADARAYTWYPTAGTSSSQCIFRVSRNNTAQQSQSGMFTVISRPVVTLNPLAEQCPGAIKISWNAIPGANGGYRIFRKAGPEMIPVATVAGTSYTITGLSSDTTYWIGVAPLINGTAGMRSLSLNRRPYNGDCSGAAHGDLRVSSIQAPGSGRQLTSTALGSNQPLTVIVSNLDDQTATNYRIAWKVNNGAWQSTVYTDPISPAGNRQITPAALNLSAAGTYQLSVAVTNLAQADPQPANDTLLITLKQLANPAMNLSDGYDEGFEQTDTFSLTGLSFMGMQGAEKWDFTQSQVKGRIRSQVNSAVTITGSHSISLDNAQNQVGNIGGSSYNTLTGTFNLGNYDTANWEVRCEFDYLLHGVPKFDTGNKVWVRGKDTDPWVSLLDYQIDTINLGIVYTSGSLSLTDVLRNAGQTFSSSTQIRFTQYDTSLIAAPYFGNGLTMDNFRLYLVTDDVAMLAIDSLYHYNCGLGSQVPLTVRVRNGVNNTVYNVQVSYQLENLGIVSGVIDSIPGKDTVSYTFSQTLDLSTDTSYQLSAWVHVPTDTYRLNDSMMAFRIRNQPVITTFPYLQDFEQNDGSFYPDGNNSSWAYGSPVSEKIDHAASGTRAWKTNLSGSYNRLENAYLYSPCFDISQLSQPTLSFSLASDIEDPGTSVYDIAYLEYSHDGVGWQRLGQAGQGTNWYNNDSVQAWTGTGMDYWRAATIPLPKDGPIVSFRFVLRSDQGTEKEGLAIDDIHVYDLVLPIFNQEQFPDAVSHDIGAGQSAAFVSGDAIGAEVINPGAGLGNTLVQAYRHDSYINADSSQYFVPKSFVIQSEGVPADSVTLRLYVPDAAIQVLRDDQACPSCSKVREVQELGITKYTDTDKGRENNTLSDNLQQAGYSFIPREKITWVPYDVGYYAVLKVRSFSEFWFNDGGPTRDQVLPADLFDFAAVHYGKRHAQLTWSSSLDAAIASYEVQRWEPSGVFRTLYTVAAAGQPGTSYNYIDTPVLHDNAAVFYRIRYLLADGSEHFSIVRTLYWYDMEGTVSIYPNPARNRRLNLEWFKGNDKPLQWSVYSITGQRVLEGGTDQDPYNGRYTFDLGGLSSGMYVLKVWSGDNHWDFKFICQ